MYYSFDEIDNLNNEISEDWRRIDGIETQTVFNLLVNFTAVNKVITEYNNTPYVEYCHMLKWRETVFPLGEDIFTTAYFAYNDLMSRKKRDVFAWNPVIQSNNFRLKKILDKGVAENHFHLKGSAPHFDLSWLSLMNKITGRKEDFASLEKDNRQNPNMNFSYKSKRVSLKYLVKKAAVIRLLLFINFNENDSNNKRSMGDDKEINNNCIITKLKRALYCESEDEIDMYLDGIQELIDAFRYEKGKRFGASNPDYAIPPLVSKSNYSCYPKSYRGFMLFYGERKLMYRILQGIFTGCSDYEYYAINKSA